MSDASKAKSEEEWRAILTPEQVRRSCRHDGSSHSPPLYASAQFRVLRLKGTERAWAGQYVHSKAAGVYSCTACNTRLYKNSTKFDSGSGWPAFFDGNGLSLLGLSRCCELSFVSAIPGAVSRSVDLSSGMKRTEITCTACGGHLGHVFKGEGYRTPSRPSLLLKRFLGEPFL
jgi:peptide-methionine (R)-S-oxide reductase